MSDHYDRYNGMEKLLSTNLAEVGTDAISREQACDALEDAEDAFGYLTRDWREVLMELPPIQPDIIYCKDCEKHNKGVGDFEITPDGKRTWIWKDRACPLVSWRGSAQGHEFDYQFCAYGKRREVTT